MRSRKRVKNGQKFIRISGSGRGNDGLPTAGAKIKQGKDMIEMRSTVILGSGCAGLTAAIYTGRAGLNPLILEGHEPGGQLSMTTRSEEHTSELQSRQY